jgi:hypothetical protein
MLKHTLGCPHTFAFRKTEMALLSACAPADISDAAVAESFRGHIAHSEGAYRQFLAHAQLAVVLGNSLFVHGTVDDASVGFVPHDSTPYAMHAPRGEEMLGRADALAWVRLQASALAGVVSQPRRPVRAC